MNDKTLKWKKQFCRERIKTIDQQIAKLQAEKATCLSRLAEYNATKTEEKANVQS